MTQRRRKHLRLRRPAWLSELLAVAGLGCLAGAAWTMHLAAGLAATGIALLLIEWRIDES